MPSIGFSTKSTNPLVTLLKSFKGFPKIAKLPRRTGNYDNA